MSYQDIYIYIFICILCTIYIFIYSYNTIVHSIYFNSKQFTLQGNVYRDGPDKNMTSDT